MNKRSPTRAQAFNASDRKTFRSMLGHLLQTEFPGFFGPAVTRLLVERIEELYERCHPPRSRLKSGQVLWLAVALDDPPARSKRIEDTRLVPVVLDLVAALDIEHTLASGLRYQTRQNKILRLFRQAHAQEAVLSLADVALLLHLDIGTISQIVLAHERATGEIIPRRGTMHDMGRSVTHKRIICYKRLVEKKPTSQVAEETFHQPEAVEHYVQCLRRIQHCQDSGLSPHETVQVTGHSLALVEEYLALIAEFGLPSLPPSEKPDSVQTTDT